MLDAIIILLVIGLVLGVLLGIADKFLRVEEDPRLEFIIENLPGYNCGACGEPGCAGFANKILEGSVHLRGCKPAKVEQLEVIEKYVQTTPGPDGEVINIFM